MVRNVQRTADDHHQAISFQAQTVRRVPKVAAARAVRLIHHDIN